MTPRFLNKNAITFPMHFGLKLSNCLLEIFAAKCQLKLHVLMSNFPMHCRLKTALCFKSFSLILISYKSQMSNCIIKLRAALDLSAKSRVPNCKMKAPNLYMLNFDSWPGTQPSYWRLMILTPILISVLILRAGQLGALVEYTSRLEGNNIVSNQTNLIRTSNKYCIKYNRVVQVLSGKPIS